MVIIRELESTIDKTYVNNIAQLHKQAFPSFFLTQLGLPFLKTLYRGYILSPYSGIIVSEDNGRLIGFIAYSNDYPRFYRDLVKHHLFSFALCSVGAAIRHPSFIKRILGAFKKSESVEKKEKYVELASICVDPKMECRGIGTKLIDYLKNIVDFNEYEFINLETDAQNNDSVNEFYVKNGFQLYRKYTTKEGRLMNEYRFSVE